MVGGTIAAVTVPEGSPSVGTSTPRLAPSAWRGLVGTPRTAVSLGQRVIVLLAAPSLADRVRLAGGSATDVQERRWTSAALLGQEQFLAKIAAKGVIAKPDLRFTRVVNGFSAIADPRAVALLERSPDVEGVFPVRAAYPAGLSQTAATGSALPSGLAEYRGRGVTVALLDTAVDPASPFLHGVVLPGFDLVDGGAAARYDQRPGGDRLETHGTETAGIVAGLGAPGRPQGLAPEVAVLPIRVSGWQRDLSGRWAQFARTDQVIAGLERAVDPNRDGDAHDAARIALVPLAEPFAAFADGPLAHAASGAVSLDTLVVVPAGNDGPGGPAFGSIAGPGGAPAALTVGAVDLAPPVARVSASVRAGLRGLLNRPLPLLTSDAPTHESTLRLVAVDDASTASFFDKRGTSRVAGSAVVVPAAAQPRKAVALAGRAGAEVVLLGGAVLPVGILDGASKRDVPVLSAPAGLAGDVTRATASGESVWLTVLPGREEPAGVRVRPAGFSSWGLGFGGELKPDVSAPGVAIGTAAPGADVNGSSRFVGVNGSSAATAVVAGVAARLAEARPDLDAAGLRAALVGTAAPLFKAPPEAGGAGVVDPGRAATVELVPSVSSISFGRGGGDGWQARRRLTVRNVSARALTVFLTTKLPTDGGIAVEARPKRLRLAPGGAARVRLRAWAVELTGTPAAIGTLRLEPRGGTAVDVPLTVVLAPVSKDLLGKPRLSVRSFPGSDLQPAVLAVRVGAISREGGRTAVEPVLRLDVFLRDDQQHQLGLLARLRDVLPGRYAFGLTGRDPEGRKLPAGAYSLRLVAWPAAGGGPVTRVVRFRIT